MPLYRVTVSGGIVPAVIVNAHSTEMALQFAQAMVASGQPVSASLATQQDVSTIPLASTLDRGDARPAIQSDPDFIRSMGMSQRIPVQEGDGTISSIDVPVRGTVPAPSGQFGQLGGGQPGAGAGLTGTGVGGGAGAMGPFGLASQQVIGQPGAQEPFRGAAEIERVLSGEKPKGEVITFGPKQPVSPKLTSTGVPIEEVDPTAGIIRGLRNRFGGVTPQDTTLGRFMLDQAPQLAAVWRQANLLGQNAGGVPKTMEQFVGGAQLPQERERAATILRAIMQGKADPKIQAQFEHPSDNPEGRLRVSDLHNLALAALSSRISPLAMQALSLPSANELRSQFIEESNAAPTANFLPFLRQRMLLDAFGA